MHKYRTHNCSELNLAHIDQRVKLSGWVHRVRDHGNLIFLDIRDHFGITQLLFSDKNQLLIDQASRLKVESVITVTGKVISRTNETINTSISTGQIEVLVEECILESAAEVLPIQINSTENDAPEDLRLKYRFLDLRHEKLHKSIILRSEVIAEIRKLMIEQQFIEFQTPILTASSPEGARDFLVPSRLHPGKFYALPQAPQQFKQLLMVSGFDRYFQIAPCFRDEDARADRSPGEFYQLDIEMSFVTQEDIFNMIEPILYKLFTKFSKKNISKPPFTRISYTDSMLKYGSDKPDLRNPLIITDVSEIFTNSNFTIFKNNVKNGKVVRAIVAPNSEGQPRSFFDKMNEFAMNEGAGGLGYISFSDKGAKGPIAKFLDEHQLGLLKKTCEISNNDTVFFVSDSEDKAAKLAGKVRTKLAEELNLIEKDSFKFCWIVDFPFYEFNEETHKLDFSHNPFSMPQGGLEKLIKAKSIQELLDIKAFQYDIVCNGIELSSGAIRNHKPEIMYKAFELAGYNDSQVDQKFGGMIKAFKFGAPPHGGIAPGIDRIVMLLADAINIREVIAFPLNQQGEDLLMQAPSYVKDSQLKELNILLSPSVKTKLKND